MLSLEKEKIQLEEQQRNLQNEIERLSALDKQTTNRLREELERIWMETKRTILFITHSVEEAVYLGDRVVVLSPDPNKEIDIIQVNMERPRHVYSPEFVDMRHQILEKIRGEAF